MADDYDAFAKWVSEHESDDHLKSEQIEKSCGKAGIYRIFATAAAINMDGPDEKGTAFGFVTVRNGTFIICHPKGKRPMLLAKVLSTPEDEEAATQAIDEACAEEGGYQVHLFAKPSHPSMYEDVIRSMGGPLFDGDSDE